MIGIKRSVCARRTLLGALAAGGGAALAACGPAQTTPAAAPTAPGPVRVEWLTGTIGQQDTNMQALVLTPFQQAHPEVDLQIVRGGLEGAQLPALVAAGNSPDVIESAGAPEYLAKLIQDITQYVTREKYDLSGYSKSAFETGAKWRDKIFGLPNTLGGAGHWPVVPYNRDLFQQVGLPDPPAKWGDPSWNADTFLHALQKTTRKAVRGAEVPGGTGPAGQQTDYLSLGINQVNIHSFIRYWPAMWRAQWLSDDYKTIVCDSPQMIEAMEYLVSLTTQHRVMIPEANLKDAVGATRHNDAFFAGRLAMATGPTVVRNVAQAVRTSNAPVAFAPLPTFKTFGAAQEMRCSSIITGARQPAAGFKLIKWLADTPNWSISRDNLPAKIGQFDAWAEKTYPGLADRVRLSLYRESIPNTVKRDPLASMPTLDQLYEVLTPMYDKLFAGEVPVAKTLRELRPQLQALIPKDLP